MTIYVFGYDKDLRETLIGTTDSPQQARALLSNYVAMNRSTNSSQVSRYPRLSGGANSYSTVSIEDAE